MKKEMILIADEQKFSRNALKDILSSRYFVIEATTLNKQLTSWKITVMF